MRFNKSSPLNIAFIIGFTLAAAVVFLCHLSKQKFSSIFVDRLSSTLGGHFAESSAPNSSTPNRSFVVDVSQYVGFTSGCRLGNQIFFFAAAVYVAELSGRRPAILNRSHTNMLNEVFDLDDVKRVNTLRPCYDVYEARALAYDARLETVARPGNSETRGKSIMIHGYWQSWKYTRGVEWQLRRYLRFRWRIQTAADEFIESIVPSSWLRRYFVRVGIHVRRGDVLEERKIQYGYTTPNETYFRKAMRYFKDRYDRVQFIVCSKDMAWSKRNIVQEPHDDSTVNVRYSVGRSAGADLAILSNCDHVIMSTGTYGWWAAWLANGTSVYYQDWPRVNSTLYEEFEREDFFPPNWIPMDDH